MHSFRKLKEDSIASHCIRNSRPRQHHNVQRAKCGDSHRHREPCRTAVSREPPHHIRRHMRRSSHFCKRQHVKVSKIHRKIKSADDQQAQQDGPGNIFFRTLDLFSEIAEIVESVERPHRGNKSCEQCTDHAPAPGRRVRHCCDTSLTAEQ